MDIKRTIGQMKDIAELNAVIRAARSRIDTLRERKHADNVAAAWERIKVQPLGQVLHVCAEGTFVGGPFQRGDSMVLVAIQPRAKRIWVDAKGSRYWFAAVSIDRYDLRTEPPAKPLDPKHRAMVERIAERIL